MGNAFFFFNTMDYRIVGNLKPYKYLQQKQTPDGMCTYIGVPGIFQWWCTYVGVPGTFQWHVYICWCGRDIPGRSVSTISALEGCGVNVQSGNSDNKNITIVSLPCQIDI